MFESGEIGTEHDSTLFGHVWPADFLFQKDPKGIPSKRPADVGMGRVRSLARAAKKQRSHKRPTEIQTKSLSRRNADYEYDLEASCEGWCSENLRNLVVWGPFSLETPGFLGFCMVASNLTKIKAVLWKIKTSKHLKKHVTFWSLVYGLCIVGYFFYELRFKFY